MLRANWVLSTSVALPQAAHDFMTCATTTQWPRVSVLMVPLPRRLCCRRRARQAIFSKIAVLASEMSLDVVSRLKKAQKALDKLKTSMENNLFRQAVAP